MNIFKDFVSTDHLCPQLIQLYLRFLSKEQTQSSLQKKNISWFSDRKRVALILLPALWLHKKIMDLLLPQIFSPIVKPWSTETRLPWLYKYAIILPQRHRVFTNLFLLFFATHTVVCVAYICFITFIKGYTLQHSYLNWFSCRMRKAWSMLWIYSHNKYDTIL